MGTVIEPIDELGIGVLMGEIQRNDSMDQEDAAAVVFGGKGEGERWRGHFPAFVCACTIANRISPKDGIDFESACKIRLSLKAPPYFEREDWLFTRRVE